MIYPPQIKRRTDTPIRIRLTGKRSGLSRNMPIAAATKKKSAMRIKTRLSTAPNHLSNSSKTLGTCLFSASKNCRCAHFRIGVAGSLSSSGFLLNIPFYSTRRGGCQA